MHPNSWPFAMEQVASLKGPLSSLSSPQPMGLSLFWWKIFPSSNPILLSGLELSEKKFKKFAKTFSKAKNVERICGLLK